MKIALEIAKKLTLLLPSFHNIYLLLHQCFPILILVTPTPTFLTITPSHIPPNLLIHNRIHHQSISTHPKLKITASTNGNFPFLHWKTPTFPQIVSFFVRKLFHQKKWMNLRKSKLK